MGYQKEPGGVIDRKAQSELDIEHHIVDTGEELLAGIDGLWNYTGYEKGFTIMLPACL